MTQLSISEVARQVGLRPSAIRYYEQMRILSPARRVSGQRRYDVAVVYQLAVLRRAQEVGFTLDEIRKLFFVFVNFLEVSVAQALVYFAGVIERAVNKLAKSAA